MLVVVRTDASLEIGSGHVMRCLTLADELRRRGAAVKFVCRAFPGHLGRAIESKGHAIALLPAGHGGWVAASGPAHSAWLGTGWEADAQETEVALNGARADWLVVDHYAIERRWHRRLRPSAARILVIDDLADRPLECDLVLDQTFGRKADDYDGLVPEGCHILAGAGFALLRPEFAAARERALRRRDDSRGIRRILVTMGGVDPSNATGAVLDILASMSWRSGRPGLDVVMGSGAPHLADVRAKAASHPLSAELHIDTQDMAGLMAAADVAIGAAGTTSWERCCLGLPSLIAVLAENQKDVAGGLARAGAAAIWAGPAALRDALERLEGLPEEWNRMSAAAAAICDGQGCRRVAEEMGVYAHA